MGRSNLMTQSKAIQFDLCETEGDWLKKVTNNEESGVHEQQTISSLERERNLEGREREKKQREGLEGMMSASVLITTAGKRPPPAERE